MHPHGHAALSAVVKRWKELEGTSTDDQINPTWSLHTVESCSAIKRNEVLTQDATHVNRDNSMLSERSQTRRDKCCMTAILCNAHRIKTQAGGYQGWARGNGEQLFNGYGVSS